MIGQRPAYKLLVRRPVGGPHLARRLGLIGLQVFQLQFQLLDLVVEFFGGMQAPCRQLGRVSVVAFK
ncbi:hypothetical protein GCM10011396_35030 [Undibacterium terreum]|uniref:Uncharacterized protein n=1 Tax=Undibacterium terreum TaxID=1224302 RepID=A0A916XMN8_9BURK|nr:hypothetical protein GCM10011396_35030 [Undibacterium terreum]